MSIVILVLAVLIIIGIALSGGNGPDSIKRRINSSREDSSADYMFYDHMTVDSHNTNDSCHNDFGSYDNCNDGGCDCGGGSDCGCGGDSSCGGGSD